MKNLFFVALALGILPVTSNTLEAQKSSRFDQAASSVGPNRTLKFIESIEIVPVAVRHFLPDEAAVAAPTSAKRQVIADPSLQGSIENFSLLQFKYALMMNRDVESVHHLSLYRFIEKWWATRYQYGGTDSTGIDCSAFTGKLLAEVYGITVARTANQQYGNSERRGLAELVEGDLVFFKKRGRIGHVGLYLGNNYFVHSSVHSGVVISSLGNEYYSKRFVSGGKVLKATLTTSP